MTMARIPEGEIERLKRDISLERLAGALARMRSKYGFMALRAAD